MQANWNAARASTWLKNYADDVASDAYRDGGDHSLYAAAGAAYYAVIMGVGYNSEIEFRQFFREHMKLDDDFANEAIKDITR